MLLRYGVSNFQSVRSYQELSLVASSLKDKGPDLLHEDGRREIALPVAMIYGANASGKTTMLRALQRLVTLVLESHSGGTPTARIPRSPFALDPAAATEPTQLDCDFIVDGFRYHYGFRATNEEFVEEWLYAFVGGHRQTWFYREQGKAISFGKNLKGRNKLIEDITRKNSLFLSVAAQNAHPQLTTIFEYFANRLTFRLVSNERTMVRRIATMGLDPRVVHFLNFADTGVIAAKLEHVERPPVQSDLFRRHDVEITPEWSEVLAARLEPIPRLSLGHSSRTGEPIFLSMAQESRGTVRLLELVNDALKTIDAGGVLVVDELDGSLHTLLARELITLFSSSERNPKGGQLIASTHDTNILCSDHLRRDQIWFTEKNSIGETHLFPLTDVKTRNTDNLEKGYLQGRFGAIPYLGTVDDILQREE
jgi:energy-coupling factor transporter ATP-binding protein EcfA2